MRTFNCLEFLYSQNPLWAQIVFRNNFEKEIRTRYQKTRQTLKNCRWKISCGFSSHTAIRSKGDQSVVWGEGRGGGRGFHSIEQVSGWGQIIPVSIETKNVFQAALTSAVAVAIAIVGIRRK